MLSFVFVILCGLFEGKQICARFVLPFVYICIAVGREGWRSSYQEGRVGDLVIKRGGLEI
jgi:hypothetical protein